MTSALLFLAVASLAPSGGAEAARNEARPVVEAHASASLRVVRGFRLTPAALDERIPGAHRVKRVLKDRDGVTRPASLVEFE